ADGRRGRARVPFPHRVPPAAADAAPAEVSRRARDRRRQLPERHVAGREGGGAAGRRRAALRRRRTGAMTPDHPLLERLRPLHRRIRDAVVESTSRAAAEALARVDADEGPGDTIYAIDRVAEDVIVSDVDR